MTPTPALPETTRRDRPRRRFVLGGLALAAGAVSPGLLRAQATAPTPRMSEGPFYPDRLPEERDADLTRLAGRSARAAGTLMVLSGRVLDTRGRPLAGAQLEVWQANTHGRYLHSADRESSGPLDPNFQGYAALRTDAEGRYRILTVRPGRYPGRTPHLHFNALQGGQQLTTQMFFADEPHNERDGLYRSLDAAARRALTARPEGSRDGALALAWDIVLPG